MQIRINELRQIIRDIIVEKRRLHVNRYEEAQQKLESYLDKGLFFHLTNDPTLPFLNVKQIQRYDWRSPVGIYVFPLTSLVWERFKNQARNLFTNMPYIVIYEPTSENYIKTSTYTWDDFLNDADRLGKKIDDLEIFKKKLDIKVPVRALLRLFSTNNDMRDNKFKINANLGLKKLGYIGIFDDVGQKVIHPKDSEPIQGFFLNSKYLNVVDVLQNLRLLQRRYDIKDIKTAKNGINDLYKEIEILVNRCELTGGPDSDDAKQQIKNLLNDLTPDQQYFFIKNGSKIFSSQELYFLTALIDEPNEKLQSYMISIFPSIIKMFKNPSINIRRNAILADVNIIFDFKKMGLTPTEEEIELAKKYFPKKKLTKKNLGL